VVAAAILLGTSVLLLLFFSSVYLSNPLAMQATFIEVVANPPELDPDAWIVRKSSMTPLGLSAANDAGKPRLARTLAGARHDRERPMSIDSEDVETSREPARR
jgi:hypothetical protein